MSYRDVREYLDALEKADELAQIKEEVDWDLEMCAIVRRSNELRSQAPFFQRIKDYPGWRAVGGLLSDFSKVAVALGQAPDTPVREILQTYVQMTAGQPVSPVMVKDAPCKENIIVGDDANLLQIPAPMVFDGCGGRYIGTWCIVVVKDPDSGEVNWGTYRTMVYDQRYLAMLMLPFSGGGRLFYGKFVPQKKPMPLAIALGIDPYCLVAGATPTALPEPDYAGMLKQGPIELVPCQTVPLEVPARAEVIIEGEMIPGLELAEGPFAEYTGFATAPRAPRSGIRVKAITHRHDPIMVISFFGAGLHDASTLFSLMMSAEAERLLRSQGIPITGAFMLPESNHHLLIVGVRPVYARIANQIANLIFGSSFGIRLYQVIVVDDTVDIYSLPEVIQAFAQRCHPAKGIHIYPHLGWAALPFLGGEQDKSRGGAVLLDCTFPVEWSAERGERPRPISFAQAYPAELQKKVLGNWQKMGLRG